MADDFGEPWAGKSFIDGGRDVYYTVDRDGRVLFQMRDGPRDAFPVGKTDEEMEVARIRIQTLVNLWAGVPTADLGAHRQAGAAADRCRVLLAECRDALREHDADYQHRTPPDLLRRLDEILGK